MKKVNVSFSAIDCVIEDKIIKNVQKEISGHEFISYGDKNIYPNYLHDLYENVSTLKSIINGLSDYVCGENITFNLDNNFMKNNIEEIIRQIAIDLNLYGGFALNIVRNKLGGIAGIYNLDFRNVRSDRNNTKFFYSEDWSKSYGRVKTTVYPKYELEGTDVNSIFYFKLDKYNTYPSPSWCGAVISAEVLKHIGEFHLNSLYNGLSSDYIVNFNQGIPSDEDKREIEDNWNEKYAGFNNGGRSMLSFNEDIQHRVTVESLPQSNYIDKYNSLLNTSIRDIYSSFRCHPALFGLPTDNTGFNSQDIKESFKVTNTTVVLPIQKIIKKQFEKIFGINDVITIKPLQINFEDKEIIEDSTEKIIK